MRLRSRTFPRTRRVCSLGCAQLIRGIRFWCVTIDTASKETTATSDEFYRETMRVLDEARVPFLVGGAYAFAAFTGISRDTKDFDVFLQAGRCRARA